MAYKAFPTLDGGKYVTIFLTRGESDLRGKPEDQLTREQVPPLFYY